eukprot:SM000193S05164  [mRNA]  locus=s193:7172:10935:- [translate_table: standard]
MTSLGLSWALPRLPLIALPECHPSGQSLIAVGTAMVTVAAVIREKLRPESELARAAAQIQRSKAAVREALRQLAGAAAEGAIPPAAFDKDGCLLYDEIFCATCKSPEFESDNDILLCDGDCSRGFHQRCLDPPLRTEDIPPDDQGWLCGLCDAKLDCIDMINADASTHLPYDASWEAVFPEAAEEAVAGTATEAGGGEWPSDDEDDGDYQPGDRRSGEDSAGASGGKSSAGDAGNGLSRAAGGSKSLTSEDSEGTSTSGSDSDDNEEGVSWEELEFLRLESGKVHEGGRTGSQTGEALAADRQLGADTADLIVNGKRRRVAVDYKRLNEELFGNEAEDGERPVLSDDEWGPARRPAEKQDGVAGGLVAGEHQRRRRRTIDGEVSADGARPGTEPRLSPAAGAQQQGRRKNHILDASTIQVTKWFYHQMHRRVAAPVNGALNVGAISKSSPFEELALPKESAPESCLPGSVGPAGDTTKMVAAAAAAEPPLLEKLGAVKVKLQELSETLEAQWSGVMGLLRRAVGKPVKADSGAGCRLASRKAEAALPMTLASPGRPAAVMEECVGGQSAQELSTAGQVLEAGQSEQNCSPVLSSKVSQECRPLLEDNGNHLEAAAKCRPEPERGKSRKSKKPHLQNTASHLVAEAQTALPPPPIAVLPQRGRRRGLLPDGPSGGRAAPGPGSGRGGRPRRSIGRRSAPL